MSATIDFNDVQGLLRYGYGRLTESCFFLLRVKDRQAAQAWFRTAPVSSALELTAPPKTALQVAFARSGLEAMGVPAVIVQQFSSEFVAGMAGDPSRSRRLGDIDANAPDTWRWGGVKRTPDLIVMLYAEPGALTGWQQQIAGSLWFQAFDILETLSSSSRSDSEPFGFRDGISQPEIDWQQGKKLPADQLAYSNRTAIGEFLLGYVNEYGKYSERPLLPQVDRNFGLLPAQDAPDKRDLGLNGSYLVVRELHQDVAGFWQFVAAHAGNESAGIQLAEAMVGRRKDGTPLITQDDAGLNDFTYESDPDGSACPFGAHIRRANPRNGDFPYGTGSLWQKLLRMAGLHRSSFRDDLVSSTRFHRLLRRGRVFGAEGEAKRGLYFVALNANISRQFEFVQNAWLGSTKFDGLSGESDPLLGNRLPIAGCPVTSGFSMAQANRPARRVANLPQFVRVRGGAYFFLPSFRALGYIASVG